MEGIKRTWSELKRVISVLETKTKVVVVGMSVFTLIVSVAMFKVFDNPILESWREDREIEEVLRERDERLEKEKKERKEKEEKREEDKNKEVEESKENKEPKF